MEEIRVHSVQKDVPTFLGSLCLGSPDCGLWTRIPSEVSYKLPLQYLSRCLHLPSIAFCKMWLCSSVWVPGRIHEVQEHSRRHRINIWDARWLTFSKMARHCVVFCWAKIFQKLMPLEWDKNGFQFQHVSVLGATNNASWHCCNPFSCPVS